MSGPIRESDHAFGRVYLAVGDGEVFALHPAAPDAARYVGYRIRSTLVDAYQAAERPYEPRSRA